MNYTTLDYTVDNKVLRLTLNRPDQMNAFTTTMGKELVHAFRRASEDDTVSVIVVSGAGKAFCAGMDLSVDGNVFGLDESRRPTLADMAEPDTQDGVRDSGGEVTLAIHDCKKPVIAAINGAAVGIGATSREFRTPDVAIFALSAAQSWRSPPGISVTPHMSG